MTKPNLWAKTFYEPTGCKLETEIKSALVGRYNGSCEQTVHTIKKAERFINIFIRAPWTIFLGWAILRIFSFFCCCKQYTEIYSLSSQSLIHYTFSQLFEVCTICFFPHTHLCSGISCLSHYNFSYSHNPSIFYALPFYIHWFSSLTFFLSGGFPRFS